MLIWIEILGYYKLIIMHLNCYLFYCCRINCD